MVSRGFFEHVSIGVILRNIVSYGFYNSVVSIGVIIHLVSYSGPLCIFMLPHIAIFILDPKP